jgi:NADPH-dependent F420 reductase
MNRKSDGTKKLIGILGGTGKEGQGLALRWVQGGVDILLGSRDATKAANVALELNKKLGHKAVRGLTNRDVASRAEAIVSALPHQGHLETLERLQKDLEGKLVMVATVIWPPGPLERPSAAEEAQEMLTDRTRVVAAFQTVSAVGLRALDKEIEDDVLVCGEVAEARKQAISLIARTGLRGIDAGPLRNSRTIEAMTGVLLQVNKAHSTKHAGIRITGLGSIP